LIYTTERIWNYQIAIETMSSMWDDISEDNAPPYKPDLIDEVYMGVYADGVYIGMYRLHALTSVLWELHAFILPAQRSHSADSWKPVQEWIVENLTGARKVIANIPECFPNVIRFAESQGFKEQGYNSESYTKNGVVGTYQLGKTIEEMKCQQD
jgi:hypothetical protein